MTRLTMERIDAALEGHLAEDEFRALQDELRHDPVAFDHWCQQAEIHGRLEWELSNAAPTLTKTPAAKGKLRWQHWAAAAAILTVGLGIGYWAGHRGMSTQPRVVALPASDVNFTTTVGRLTAVDSPQWIGNTPATGDWLTTGKLELTSGNAEITFDSGATLQLHGPTILHVTSPTQALLEKGAATVDIPRQAYGFVFETPTAEISDRVSRFAVQVDKDRHTDIHVLDGQIQLSGKFGDLQTLNLTKDKSVRVNGDGSLTLRSTANTNPIIARMPETADLLPLWYLHWDFNAVDTTNGIFAESGHHPDLGNPLPAQVHLARTDADVSLVPGRFGNAIRMNGQNAFLSTEFSGLSDHSPRTIAFWVKIAPNTPNALAYSFLSWGTKTIEGGGKWQLSWNTGEDNTGAIGAIRTEVEKGFHIGSTNLRTGHWHHVVCVFTGERNADVASEVRHYIDGRLEVTTAVRSRRVDTLTTGSQALPLSFGRRLDQDHLYRTYSGEMDEVYIFPCALTPEQIECLYRDNQAPPLRR